MKMITYIVYIYYSLIEKKCTGNTLDYNICDLIFLISVSDLI